MQSPRHQFLARPALTVDQNAPIGRRRQSNLLPQRLHRNAAAQYLMLLLELRPQSPVLSLQPQIFQRIANHQNHFFQRQRFFDKIKRPQLRSPHRRLNIRVPRNHHHHRRPIPLLHPLQRLQPIHLLQPHVQKDQIKSPRLQTRQTLFPRSHGLDLIPLVAQQSPERFAYPVFIIHNKYRSWHVMQVFPASSASLRWTVFLCVLRLSSVSSVLNLLTFCSAYAGETGISAAGNRITNRVPVGKLSSTRIVPLCSAIIRLAIANPNPVPRSLVEKCGKNSRSLSSGEIPCPLSDISISTASPSPSTRVATRIRRIAEPSIASAALSIRLASTRRNNSRSAFTGGNVAANSVRTVTPSSRP